MHHFEEREYRARNILAEREIDAVTTEVDTIWKVMGKCSDRSIRWFRKSLEMNLNQ
jgi:hypothetical protein